MTEDVEWQRQIADNARRCEELRARVAAISVTETSSDGTIRVTVSANGVLTDLVLSERRQFVPQAQVGAQIMACVRRAQARIPDLVRQAMQQTVGTEDQSAQLILADTSARFPAAPPEPPRPRPQPAAMADRVPPARPAAAPPPPPRTRPPQPRNDADWDERPILEALDGDGR